MWEGRGINKAVYNPEYLYVVTSSYHCLNLSSIFVVFPYLNPTPSITPLCYLWPLPSLCISAEAVINRPLSPGNSDNNAQVELD